MASAVCKEHAKAILAAILTNLPKESSKLKILTLWGEKDEHAADDTDDGYGGWTIDLLFRSTKLNSDDQLRKWNWFLEHLYLLM